MNLINNLHNNIRYLKEEFMIKIKYLMAYRLNFVLFLVSEITYLFIIYISSKAIANNVNLGLTGEELFFYSLYIDIVMSLVSTTEISIVNFIRNGELNYMLVLPKNIFLLILTINWSVYPLLFNLIKLIFVFYLAYLYSLNVVFVIILTILLLIFAFFCQAGFDLIVESQEFKREGLTDMIRSLFSRKYFNNIIYKFPVVVLPKLFMIYMFLFPLYYIAQISYGIVINNWYYATIWLCLIIIMVIVFVYFARKSWYHNIKYYKAEGS